MGSMLMWQYIVPQWAFRATDAALCSWEWNNFRDESPLFDPKRVRLGEQPGLFLVQLADGNALFSKRDWYACFPDVPKAQ